jgi:hypothetical protein
MSICLIWWWKLDSLEELSHVSADFSSEHVLGRSSSVDDAPRPCSSKRRRRCKKEAGRNQSCCMQHQQMLRREFSWSANVAMGRWVSRSSGSDERLWSNGVSDASTWIACPGTSSSILYITFLRILFKYLTGWPCAYISAASKPQLINKKLIHRTTKVSSGWLPE